jgi:hypothetical protein
MIISIAGSNFPTLSIETRVILRASSSILFLIYLKRIGEAQTISVLPSFCCCHRHRERKCANIAISYPQTTNPWQQQPPSSSSVVLYFFFFFFVLGFVVKAV